jgi:hypothetical protein
MLEIETAGDFAVGDKEFYDDRGSWEEFTGLELDPEEAPPLAPDGRQYRKVRADDKTRKRGRDRTQIEIVVRKRWVPLSERYSGEWSGRAGWADGPKTPDCYRTGEPIAHLLDARWCLANLGPEEERELIRRAQAGDNRAANELHRRFHKLILKIASETRFAALDWSDRIAAGHRALWSAISRFDLDRPAPRGRNEPIRLASYLKGSNRPGARPGYIAGVLLDDVKAKARFGMKRVPKNVCVKLADYNEALAEASWDEEDTDAAQREAKGIVHRVAAGNTDHSDPYRLERQHVLGIEGRILKTAGRKVSKASAPFALERLAEEADRLLARRIALVGRRTAANELVERKRKRIARRTDPTNYLYPRVPLPTKEKEQWMIIVVSKRTATSWRSGHRDR